MRALVVYQHLPHYRFGVFRALQKSVDITFDFAADVRSRHDAVPTMPAATLERFFRLRNHWFGPFLWQSGLVRILHQGRYDSVLFLGDFGFLSTWVGASMCRLAGVRVFFWTIGWHKKDRGIRRVYRIAFFRLAHQLLLYGNVGRSIGEQLGYPGSRMRVVGNSHCSSLDKAATATDDRLGEIRGLLAMARDEVVGAVIRLNPEKRLDLLLRAVEILTRAGRDVTVVLAGAGPEHDALFALGKELGIDLRMLGACYSAEELELIYEHIDITVVPVCAGLTAIQSLKYGRPVITTDNEYNQMPESECIREGLTGYLYADGSINGCAETIGLALDAVQSDREGFAAKCREEIDLNWSVEAHALAIHEALMESRADRAVR